MSTNRNEANRRQKVRIATHRLRHEKLAERIESKLFLAERMNKPYLGKEIMTRTRGSEEVVNHLTRQTSPCDTWKLAELFSEVRKSEVRMGRHGHSVEA